MYIILDKENRPPTILTLDSKDSLSTTVPVVSGPHRSQQQQDYPQQLGPSYYYNPNVGYSWPNQYTNSWNCYPFPSYQNQFYQPFYAIQHPLNYTPALQYPTFQFQPQVLTSGSYGTAQVPNPGPRSNASSTSNNVQVPENEVASRKNADTLSTTEPSWSFPEDELDLYLSQL